MPDPTTITHDAGCPALPGVLVLHGKAQRYAWGTPHQIPTLFGLEPDGEPYAEWWLGDHPVAPSTLRVDGHERTLGTVVGEPLPYLLKVLSVGAPLSLQVHPTRTQAVDGFDREDALGIAVDAAHRSYRDRNHKPELIVALTPFDALCGFVSPAEAARRLAALGPNGELRAVEDVVRASPQEALDPGIIRLVLTADKTTRVGWCDAIRTTAERAGLAHLRSIADRYPHDGGVVLAALLNVVHLEPGEGLYLDAGILHAYLSGLGVEVMANSDNVVRGGLTPKHIDIDELVAIAQTCSHDPATLHAAADGDLERWNTPAPDFALRRLHRNGSLGRSTSPRIVLCTSGHVCLTAGTAEVQLHAGQSAYLAPGETAVATSDDPFEIFEASGTRDPY